MKTRIAALLAAAIVAPHAFAQGDGYPNKPIRMIVPYAAGGSTDQLARAIQQSMSETLGQTVIVENKPGAGGTIGTDYVAKAAPDGYTLVFGNTGPNAVVSLMRKVPYDELKDLRPISTVAITPMILAVPADSPAKTLKDFLAYAKKNGNALNVGSVGNGSLSHLTAEYFNEAAGLRMQHIPYNGGAPMMTAFAGGQLQAAFVTGLDGATLVKEIRKLETSAMTTGNPVVWGSDAAVWFVMVKDAKGRFASNPLWGDGWGWALFKADAPAKNVAVSYAADCMGCHVPAAKTDRVFIQGYPTLTQH